MVHNINGGTAMDCEFIHFCSCDPSGYALLRERIQQCAHLGHSYEFSHCKMPSDCTPEEITLGFWYHQGIYQIYFKPSISYHGHNRRLNFFFSRPVQSFNSFESLTLNLMALGSLLAVPSSKADSMPPFYHQLYQALNNVVLGQTHAIEAVAFKLYGHICKTHPTRPMSLILHGPTGVGKSELGKGIVNVLREFHESYQFVWTELNTFIESHSVYRLTGAPPGYVGYEDPPIFEAVRHNPKTVFMFDELEKAHPNVLKVFMSILDEGRCTAHREGPEGERELDFRQCIFLFTTNANLSGETGHRLGFAPPAEDSPKPEPSTAASNPADLARRLFQEDETARHALVRQGVLTEIAGRFSGLIAFQTLDPHTRIAITRRQIQALGQEYGIHITHIAWELAEALTPKDSLSARSTVGILEGILTPFLLTCTNQASQQMEFELLGTVDHMQLRPRTYEPILSAP